MGTLFCSQATALCHDGSFVRIGILSRFPWTTLITSTLTTYSRSYLEAWAKEGVLLLNASLTVRAHSAASHSGKGWEAFTGESFSLYFLLVFPTSISHSLVLNFYSFPKDAIINYLNEKKSGLVFMLWGSHAQKKGSKINQKVREAYRVFVLLCFEVKNVFLLSISIIEFINFLQNHLVLKAVHPSPLSAHRGFMDCKHWSQANKYLEQRGKAPVNWNCLA